MRVTLLENAWFDTPVAVSLSRANVAYNINSVRQAAAILLHNWPVEGGRKHATAMKACMYQQAAWLFHKPGKAWQHQRNSENQTDT